MLTIGFTTVYYTLWDVNSFMKSALVNGEVKWYRCTSHQYLRNLSHDLDKAKEKVMGLGQETQYNIDLDLHGTKWFVTETEVRVAGQEHDYTFSFGRMKGQDIRVAGAWIPESRARYNENLERDKIAYSEDAIIGMLRSRDYEDAKAWKDVAWQLDRAMRMESTARRKVYARRRLIELGELVRRDWKEKIPVYDAATENDPYAPIKYREVVRKWMPKGLAKWHDEIGSKKGFFYKDKERRKLTIKQVKSKMVDTEYGTMYIVDYLDSEGHIVTYKGGRPVRQSEAGQPFEVTATIKHTTTRGGDQTFIQRLKQSI